MDMMQSTDLDSFFDGVQGPAQQQDTPANTQASAVNTNEGTSQPTSAQAVTDSQVNQGTASQSQQPMMNPPQGGVGNIGGSMMNMMGSTSAPPAVQQTSAPAMVDNNFSIGLPDAMQNELADVGIEVGDIGVKVSRVPIDKYKASASKIDRIGFIFNKVIPIKMHYIENVGSIICFHGKCCEVAGTPMVRYLFPIVVYTTDADGNICGGKVSLQMLSLGEDAYRTIITISKSCASMGGMDHVDLLVTCTDETYQKMTFVQAGPAVWRQYPNIANFLRDKWMQDGAKSYMAVARKMDEETFLKVMNMDDAGADNSAQSFDPSKNTDLAKFFSN